MREKNKIWAVFLLLLLFAGCKPPPVNWTRSFDSGHKMPFGTFILRKELPKFFPDAKITDIKQPTDEFFDDLSYEQDALYMFIFDSYLKDSLSWENILYHVHEGGSAFIALSGGNEVISDRLGVFIKEGPLLEKEKSVRLSVKNPEGSSEYIFQKGVGTSYISRYNSSTTEILGFLISEEEKEPNLARISYGDGVVLLSTEPIAFTNYHLLKKNHYRYAEEAFSYLKPADILWDNSRLYSRGLSEKNDGGFFDSLSFIFNNPSLRSAFILLLILGILYLIFNTRRRQRAVPILLPYTNYKLDFAKTLAELYRYEADHTAMVKYKIRYFLEQLRINYHINPKDTEGDFTELLSAKSGVDKKTCQKLVTRLGLYRQKDYLDRNDFFRLHSLIQQFNQKTKHHGRKPQ